MIALALLALAARPVLSIDLFYDQMDSCSINWDGSSKNYGQNHFQGDYHCPGTMLDRSLHEQCANIWSRWDYDEPVITSKGIAISDSSQLTFEYDLVVADLKDDEACYAEYSLDGGQTFTTLASYGEADQGKVWQPLHTLPLSDTADADEINLRFRLSPLRDRSDGLNDIALCFVDDVALTALSRPMPPTNPPTTTTTKAPTPKPTRMQSEKAIERRNRMEERVSDRVSVSSSLSSSCTATSSSSYSAAFEVLTGGGSVLRSYLTYDQLTQASFPWLGPVDYRAMAIVPGNAAEPVDVEFAFEGVFELDDVNQNLYADIDDAKLTLPPISAELVQHGSYLLPADRTLRRSTHPYWDYLLGVGRVWREDGDHGMLRAALPFSLTQKNSNQNAVHNAVHNGVLIFLFDATSISNVWYQITSENMFGAVTASYTPSTVAAKCDIIDAYATEVTNGVAVEPMAELSRAELSRAAARAHIGSELEFEEGAEREVDAALITITTDEALAVAVALLICVNVCVAMEIMRRRASAGTWCKKTSYANVQWGEEDSEAVMQSEAEQILQVSN